MSQRNAPPIGWPLLPVPDPTGRMQWPDLEQSVLQRIKVILQTRPREQLMRPTFGAGLQNFVGQPDSIATRKRLQDHVRSALETWEPRIRVDEVEVCDDDRPGWLRVEIRFRIRRTGVPRRLGLTLALENG